MDQEPGDPGVTVIIVVTAPLVHCTRIHHTPRFPPQGLSHGFLQNKQQTCLA